MRKAPPLYRPINQRGVTNMPTHWMPLPAAPKPEK
ncbi:DUF551 domain-containing protein [Serratia liquefaciens]|nr:DUF551 domain-containing protein [Serratia liquefaciens]